MGKQSQQRPLTSTTGDDGTLTIIINFYALSLTGARKVGEDVELDSAASFAPPPIDSVEAAHAHGMQEALALWPKKDGWDQRVAVKMAPFYVQIDREAGQIGGGSLNMLSADQKAH